MSQAPHFLTPLEPLLRAYVERYGKLAKAPVLYTPDGVTPPPLGWVYRCESCRYWVKGTDVGKPRSQGRCQLVSEQGPPDTGTIKAGAWCAVWSNRDDDAILSWIRRSLNGEPAPWEK